MTTGPASGQPFADLTGADDYTVVASEDDCDRAMLATHAPPMPSHSGVLLCDPLTGLVAYPSFAAYMKAAMPAVAGTGVHLAVGDVDDLRGYVSESRSNDGALFGHLAGNLCMRQIGGITVAWAAALRPTYSLLVCGTFGGDEVIVAASAAVHDRFVAHVEDLADRIRDNAPRPCSFAIGTLLPVDAEGRADPATLYDTLVSTVDAALLDTKHSIRSATRLPTGLVVDVGTVVPQTRGARR